MAKPIQERFKDAWNAFTGREQNFNYSYDLGVASYGRPDKVRLRYSNVKTIVAPIYNAMANSVAQCMFEVIRTDSNNNYVGNVNSGLNDCLTLEANIDQPSKAFIRDLVLSLFDEGVVAVAPVDADVNPRNTEAFDILSLRTAKIVTWYPSHVQLDIYNDREGTHQQITVPKYKVAIIENPFYVVMNETNSAVQRYIRKLALLDKIDEQQGSGRLDLVVQLPYLTRSPRKKQEAETRRLELERQLSSSDYGVAYTDGSEKIVQLNRPLENTVASQVEKLETLILNQLGISRSVFEGTASEEEMQLYYNRAIEPVCSAITQEFTRKFISRTARTQGQSVTFRRDPFALMSMMNVANTADRLISNEVLSPNEFRAILGFKPVDDERAYELRNRNVSQSPDAEAGPGTLPDDEGYKDDIPREEM